MRVVGCVHALSAGTLDLVAGAAAAALVLYAAMTRLALSR